MPETNSDRLRSAREAAQIGKLTAQELLTRRLVRKTQNGTVGQATIEPEDGESVNIHIGDKVTQPPGTTGLGKAARVVALGAAILGAGGLGAAGTAIVGKLLSPPAAATDTDTRYSLELVPEVPTPANP